MEGGGTMDRIPLLGSRDELDDEGRAVFDRITRSRGEVTRPFELLLHAPELAERVADLGHVVRFGSHLADRDRELATLATGRAHGCAFVWDSHLETARAAGIDSETLAALEAGGDGLGPREGLLVAFVTDLCTSGSVPLDTFDATRTLVGTRGVVELALTVGYYTMLSYTMGACDAC